VSGIYTHMKTEQESNPDSNIDFSVVIALLNHGGHWQESIRSWACEQDYPRDRYEVIVVSNGKRSIEKDVKELLSQHDSVIVCDLTDEMSVYDYGMRKGRGKFLFFAEAHSVGMPNCLTEMMNYLVETGRPGAMCQSFGAWKSYVGGLQEQVFQDENAVFGAGDHWHRIALRGTAILKSVYLQFGGFPKKYSNFADRYFDIELFRHDMRLGFAHKSVVKHHNVTGYAHLEFSIRLFTHGECEYREDFSDRQCEIYIGASKPWRERFFYDPVIARLRFHALRKIVARKLFQQTLTKSNIEMIPALIDAGLASALGVEWPLLRTRVETKLWKISTRILHALGSKKLVRPAFQRYFQTKLVDFYRYEYIAKNPPQLKCPSLLSFPMDTDLDDSLVDFHSIEQNESGKHYRWTQPISVLNTKLPIGNYILELEDAKCRPPDRNPNLSIFFNQHELESLPSQPAESILRFKISSNQFSNSEFQHLILISDCFQPSRHGSIDTRRLGIPIAKIEFRPVAAKSNTTREQTQLQTV